MKSPVARTALRLVLLGVGPAFLVGATIMVLHGAPISMPLINFVAMVLGVFLVAFVGGRLSAFASKHALALSMGIIAFLAATFLDEGLEGVFRWVRLGPLRLNPSAIISPLLLFAVVASWRKEKTGPTLAIVATVLAVHVAQPDAGQTTALSLAFVMLAVFPDKRTVGRLLLVLSAVGATCFAWSRRDPLEGVAMVEDIVPRAYAMHAGLGLLAGFVLLLLPIAALAYAYQSRKNQSMFSLALVLAAYLFGTIIVVAFGEFPTPVLGFGASPMLGAVLGLGMLPYAEEWLSGC